MIQREGKRNNEPDPQEAWDGARRLSDERPPGIMVSLRFGPKLTVPWKKKNDNTGEASREKEPVPKQGNKDPLLAVG